VPERGPKLVIRQPTPTMKPIKNGPEILNFRPVLRFLAALANRRLQPLGHLTAEAKYTAHKDLRDCDFLAFPSTVFKPPPSSDSTRKSGGFRNDCRRIVGTLAEMHRESGAGCWRAMCVVAGFQSMTCGCPRAPHWRFVQRFARERKNDRRATQSIGVGDRALGVVRGIVSSFHQCPDLLRPISRIKRLPGVIPCLTAPRGAGRISASHRPG
jgi:hypothetical protein